MPKLQNIAIDGNRVITLRTSCKASWPRLVHLGICNNHILDGNPLTKLFLKKLNWFYPGNENNNTKQLVSMNFFVKLQPQSLKDFDLRDQNIIRNKRFYCCYVKKYLRSYRMRPTNLGV